MVAQGGGVVYVTKAGERGGVDMAERDPVDLRHSSPNLLARLMDVEDRPEALFAPGDVAPVYRHQMSVRLDDAMELALPATPGQRTSPPPGQLTFADALLAERPSAAVLEAVKEYAKRLRGEAAAGVPAEVASSLYYLAIAAALARCGGKRISSLDDATTRSGLLWTAALPFLDDQARRVIDEALAKLA